MQSRVLVGALAAVVVAGAGSPLRADSSEIAWIAQLPGVSATVQTSGRGADGVYTVTGDSATVFEKLKSGFTRRGWTIAKATNTGLAGISVRTLIAHKGGAEVKAVINEAMGNSQLIVSSRGEVGEVEAAEAPAAAPAAPAPAAPRAAPRTAAPRPAEAPAAAPAAPAKTAARGAAARLDVPESAKGTFQCNDSQVVVNGNNGDFTLEGKCRQVIVNGNSNRIQIEAAVEAVSTNGNGNTVMWSAAQNPTAPRTSDLGNGNRIRKLE